MLLPRVASELDGVIAGRALRTVYQPIVDLATGRVVAYEALSRGPRGSALERPDQLFGQAAREDRLGELDWACQASALRTAMAAEERPQRLFVNVEPDTTGERPQELTRLYAHARGAMSVVLEVTERALTTRPAELLRRVAELRALGCAIAIDDVGADSRSLAMMAFLAPDVIKLDLRLVQERPDAGIAEVVGAVNAQAERTGAQVLVEGIETGEHAAAAIAMGATLGQGWLFGRPEPLPSARITRSGGDSVVSRPIARRSTPFELVAASPRLRVSTKPLLFAMSKHLEREALSLGQNAVLLSAFEDDGFFTPDTRRRYARIARDVAFCGALGRGMADAPAPGVRGMSLAGDDPLAGEWNVAVISPHFAGALIARDLGDRGPDEERRFEYVVTYERDVAIAAATAMMARISA